jgi:hypothetical protein
MISSSKIYDELLKDKDPFRILLMKIHEEKSDQLRKTNSVSETIQIMNDIELLSSALRTNRSHVTKSIEIITEMLSIKILKDML